MPRVVLANGVFDILHAGHIDYLEQASQLGYLCVSVTRDRSIYKGREITPQRERVKIIKALRCVKRVILVDSSLEALKIINPDIFIKGEEYKRRIRKEDRAWCKENGCKIVFTPKTHSSTTIHARIRLA